jgi:catechol 2,3-dioxygenase-like lactoylglutathione lyase family enzyme
MLDFFQIALVSTDLPATLRFYADVFGYSNAGAQGSWGSRIQGMGREARHIMWWLVGDQPFFQLELFGYTHPVTRPLPEDWRPSDHGWTRFGISVPDFDSSLKALKRNKVELIAPVMVKNGRRHVAVRDPHAGPVVEIIESGLAEQKGPVVSYVTSSVSDIKAARAFYANVLQLKVFPLERLHTPEDEALWGLPGAQREGFVAEAQGGLIEVVSYSQPQGRPRRPDHRLADQGIQNVSLGSRSRDVAAQLIDRVKAAGYTPPFLFENGGNICAYINDAEREFELASIPESFDYVYGFLPLEMDLFGKRNSKLWEDE